MKHLKHIALLAALCLTLTAPADAQVSVRRTPKKESTEKKDDKPAAAKPAAASKPAASAKPAAAPAAKPAATTPAKSAAPARGTSPTRTTPGASPARTTPARAQAAAPVTADGKTLREQAFDDYQHREAAQVPWQHVVYRELDLTRGANASLYYPEEPTDGLTNLFRVIVDLLASGQVKGYEYLDGREIFTEKYEVRIRDVFDKFEILYSEKTPAGKGGAPAMLSVDESDIPSNEVLSYFIKERWEYDYQTAQYGPRLLAICPVFHRAGDFGGDAVKYPMLWINYEDLRPYLRSHLIVSDGINAAPRYTMEDFFALHQYQGDIYKVQNLRGLSLMQQYPDPDTLRMARARIEAQLRGFSDSIWVSVADPDDEPAVAPRRRAAATVADSLATPAPEGAKRNRRTKEAVDMEAVEAAEEAKAAQEDESIRRTGVARSVRRRR